jgi:peptide/nickel transport system ATP-binding protein
MTDLAHPAHTETPSQKAASSPLLDVRDLGIAFQSGRSKVQVTRDVSFSIAPGEIVGLVGESGCGKTVTGLALMGLLPPLTSEVTGEILLEGENLVGMPPREIRLRRGRKISMIFQEPMSALDPVFTIGEQISETLRAHRRVGKKEARERAIDALAKVGIPEPALRYNSYPHQLSGGMRQRAMIAIALVCEPRLLIADEPTTALDVTVQAQIVDVLGELCSRLGMAMLFITHDLGLVAQTCSRLVTMYAGEVVEQGLIDDVLARPRHPYSSGLLRSLPALSARKTTLPSIPGRVPARGQMPEGCRFRPRCGYALPQCENGQPLFALGGAAHVRCWRHKEIVPPGVLA